MSATPVSTTPSTMSTPKTLPMKYKAMHYTLVQFIFNDQLIGLLPDELKAVLINKIPIYESVENQINFYDKLVDFKKIETDILKPMIKQRKEQEKLANKPVQEKKPRAPRKKKELPVVAESETTVANEETPSAVVNEEAVVTAAATPSSESVLVETVAQEETKDDSTEMQLEPYVEEKVEEKVQEKTKRKRVPKKKQAEPKAESKPDEPEYSPLGTVLHLVKLNGNTYWTNDENNLEGNVYEYSRGKDSDGDPLPGKKIGILKNGNLIENK